MLAFRHGSNGSERPIFSSASDLQIARGWGQLSAALGNDNADLIIAATALEHSFTVVTRNVLDFEPTGVAILSLFDSRPSRRR